MSIIQADRIEVNEIIIKPTSTPLNWNSKRKHHQITITTPSIAKSKKTSKECGILVNTSLKTGETTYKWYYESKAAGDIYVGLAHDSQDLGTIEGVYVSKKLTVSVGDIIHFNLCKNYLIVLHIEVGGKTRKQYVFDITPVGDVCPWVSTVPCQIFYLKVYADLSSTISSDNRGNFNISCNIFKNGDTDIKETTLMKLGDKECPGIDANTLNTVLQSSIDNKQSGDKLWSSSHIEKKLKEIDIRDVVTNLSNELEKYPSINDKHISPSTLWSSNIIDKKLINQNVKESFLKHVDDHIKIDDAKIKPDSTWSSSKIHNEMKKINIPVVQRDIQNVIKDNKVSSNSLWSSEKIMKTIQNNTDLKHHTDDRSIHIQISDTGPPSSNTVWSSTRTANSIQKCDNAKKVNDHITNSSIHYQIDDSSISSNTVWSSTKTTEEIETGRQVTDIHVKDNKIHIPLDDSKTHTSSLWSSKKTSYVINESVKNIINDKEIGNHAAWSSCKTNKMVQDLLSSNKNEVEKHISKINDTVTNARAYINTHINDDHVHVQIDDTTTESKSLWSSKKVTGEINKVVNDIIKNQKEENTNIKTSLEKLKNLSIDKTATNRFHHLIAGSLQSKQATFNGTDVITKDHLDTYITNHSTGKNIEGDLFVSKTKVDTSPAAYIQMWSGDITYALSLKTRKHYPINNEEVINFIMNRSQCNIDVTGGQVAGFNIIYAGVYKINTSVCFSCDNDVSKISYTLFKNGESTGIGSSGSNSGESMQLTVDAILKLNVRDNVSVHFGTKFLNSVINFNHININAHRLYTNTSS